MINEHMEIKYLGEFIFGNAFDIYLIRIIGSKIYIWSEIAI